MQPNHVSRFLRRITFAVSLITLCAAPGGAALAGAAEMPSVAEQLGFAADARLLIIHADDIGMSHSVNAATLPAMRAGRINSGSMMVPCAWFAEAADYYRRHPGLDLGIHLTLTSEWKHYRWQSLSGNGPGYSLHNNQGYQYADVPQVVQHAEPEDVRRELHAQVDAALAHGITPTHLDSHMGTLFATPELFRVYVETGRRYQLPVLLPRTLLQAQAPELLAALRPNEVLVDHLIMADANLQADNWDEFYSSALQNLQPGVTQIIIHAGLDNTELQAITIDHPDFGAAWRQRDLQYFGGPRVADLLQAHNVHLVTWRQLGALLYPRQAAR